MAAVNDVGKTAVEFLRRFWARDIAGACELCTPESRWIFARSLPYARECPVREALERIDADLFERFDPPGGFDVSLRHVGVDGPHALVEYSARGRLDDGRAYENDYVMSIEVRDGRIVEVRPYTDTLHLARLFGVVE